MEMFLYILVSICSFVSVLVILHYFVLALRKPEKLVLFVDNLEDSNRTHPFKMWAYYAFLWIGLMAMTYAGTKLMFFWIPSSIGSIDEGGEFVSLRDYIAFTTAFFSPILSTAMVELARNKVQSKFLGIENEELKSIINAPSELKYTIEKFNKLKNDAATQDEVILYSQLLKVSQDLDEKVDLLLSSKIDQINREREEKEKRDQMKANAKKLEEDNAKQLQYYNNALKSKRDFTGIKVINKYEDIDDGPSCLIEAFITRKKWETLDKIANSYLGLNDNDIKTGREPININGLFDSCAGIYVVKPGNIMAAYSGDSQGGSTAYYIETALDKESYLHAINLTNSLDALIEGYYVALELPRKGVFWHGLYGRDYNFIFNNDQLVNVLKSRSTKPTDGKEIDRLGHPAGLRVIKSGDEYCVSCLAFYPDGAIKDLSILIKGGQIEICPDIEIMDATSQMFY